MPYLSSGQTVPLQVYEDGGVPAKFEADRTIHDAEDPDPVRFSVSRDAKASLASTTGKTPASTSIRRRRKDDDHWNPLVIKYVQPLAYSYWPGTEPVDLDEIVEDTAPLRAGRGKKPAGPKVKKTTRRAPPKLVGTPPSS